MTDQRPAALYRFGVFEADAATGELRRQGVRIKLNAQPFQVLSLLLDRPGELLTREEISQELWPTEPSSTMSTGSTRRSIVSAKRSATLPAIRGSWRHWPGEAIALWLPWRRSD